MTIDQIKAIEPDTEAFEVAVDLLSDLVADGDKSAEPVLMYALQRNADFIRSAVFWGHAKDLNTFPKRA